jgi:hypothetical protein
MCIATQLAYVAGETDPEAVRNDSSKVYWISTNGGGVSLPGSLYGCAKTGCGNSPTKLYGSINYARSLVLDTSLNMTYVADSGSKTFLLCPTAGCGSAPIVVSKGPIRGLDQHGLNLFGVVNDEPHQFKTDGTNDIDLGNGAEVAYDIVAPPGNASYVYWTIPPADKIRVGVTGIPNSGNDFVITPTPARVIADSSNLIWHSGSPGGSTIFSCTLGAVCTAPIVLAENQILDWVFGGFISDGTTVYWTAYDSFNSGVAIRSCAVTGCNKTPKTLAVVHTASLALGMQMGGLTLDQDYLYFAFSDGGTYVYRVAR